MPFSFGSLPADPNWGTALTTIAFNLIDHYGDTETVALYYNNIVQWVDYLVQRATENGHLGLGKMYYNYGDWVPPPPVGMTNQSLCSSFALLIDLQHLATISSLLNHPDDALYYTDLYNTFAEEFHQVFYNKEISGYADGKQTANVLALTANVAPSDVKDMVITSLLSDIAAYDTHLTTGIIGTKYLFPLLSDLGYHEIALQIAQQKSYPSYGYMISNPYENATTLWELWDAPFEGPGMNSRNHIMFGSIDGWFYRYLAGMNPNGLEEISFTPPTLKHDQLQFARASYESAKGLILIHWQWVSEDTYQIEVQVPHNTRGVIRFPEFPVLKLTEGDSIIFDGLNVADQAALAKTGILNTVVTPQGQVSITIGSGHFSFYTVFDTTTSTTAHQQVSGPRNGVFSEYVSGMAAHDSQLMAQAAETMAQLIKIKYHH